MSYNTRRNTPQAAPAASSVGQRRPAVGNNFVSGGQLNTPQKLGQQQPRMQPGAQQQQQTGINFRNQNQQGNQQNFQSGYAQGQQQATPRPAPAPALAIKQEPKAAVAPTAAPVLPGANPPAPEASAEPKKFSWKTKGGKVNKAERNRRRNLRLSKILQPKNAIMILNELIKGCTYTVEELPVKVDQNQFRGVVVCEGQEFAGTGRTKSAAKNSAAETALKHLIKTKQFVKRESDSEDKMDVDGQEGSEQDASVMPWCHIASFAVYKLFSAWGEDPALINKITGQETVAAVAAANNAPKEPNKAKKMPENASTLNPIMLMNQMQPGAVWEEVGKSGTPPNVMFSFQVTVGDKCYTGSATTKKAAKKLAAFAACHDLLQVNYPPDIWSPLY